MMTGNVCLPKSVPCNGYCTGHYRLVDISGCQFDPGLVRQARLAEPAHNQGTIAPLATITFLIVATIVGLALRR